MSNEKPTPSMGFEDFRRMARDPNLSLHEKIGFPDSYRQDQEQKIFADICTKLSRLQDRGVQVLDIGPGCGPLADLLISNAAALEQNLFLVDSIEMLDLIDDQQYVTKIHGAFPDVHPFVEDNGGGFDVVLAYSVIQYPFAESGLNEFTAAALDLLAPGGQLLYGDIPNLSMRKRYFGSDAGQEAHRAYTGQEDPPPPPDLDDSHGLNDEVIVSLLRQARQRGYHAWVMPQHASLPMANRREDILFVRP